MSIENKLLELYPELQNHTQVEVHKYVEDIEKSINSAHYELWYYEKVAHAVKSLNYKPEDEAFFATAIISTPLLLCTFPKVHQTLRMWQILFHSITYDIDQLVNILSKIPKEINRKLFDEETSIIFLKRLGSRYGSDFDTINKHIPTKFLTNHTFLVKALSQGVSFEILDKFIKRAGLDITPELAQHYITHLDTNFKDIAYLPANVRQKIITAAVAKKVIRLNPELIQYIPASACDEALYLQVVKHSGKLVKYAAKDKVTRKVYEAALKNDVDSMIYIPEELRDMELFTITIKSDPRGLRYVPDEIQTADLVKMAVKKNPLSLRYVADNFITNELCALAVASDYIAYKLIPDDFRTKEITALAVKHADTKSKMKALIRFVPDAFVPDYAHLL